MSDTTGYTSLLPESPESDRGQRPQGTSTSVQEEGVLEFPVQMSDKAFDEGLVKAAANVQTHGSAHDDALEIVDTAVETGRKVRRSTRNVSRPASYGR